MSTAAVDQKEWESSDDVVMNDPYTYGDGPTAPIDMSLFIACRNGNIDEVRRLLDGGSSVNVENHTGRTALHVACLKNHINIVAVLIEAKADVNVQDTFGIVPLHYAVSDSNTDLVDLLLKNKANPNVIDCDGRNLLDHAKGNKEVIEKLVAAGARSC